MNSTNKETKWKEEKAKGRDKARKKELRKVGRTKSPSEPLPEKEIHWAELTALELWKI